MSSNYFGHKTGDYTPPVEFEVGDIVKPGKRKFNGGYYSSSKYSSLCYASEYIVTNVVPSRSRTKHQLLQLEVFTRGTGHRDDQDGALGTATGYDSRNMIFVRKGSGLVETNVNGTVKPTARWIIVDGATGKIAACVADVDVVEVKKEEPVSNSASRFGGTRDAVAETVAILSKNGYAKSSDEEDHSTEDRVDDIIAGLLRKNPEGQYLAYKLNKTGRLPTLPVMWTKA